jgi:hypothetical protein
MNLLSAGLLLFLLGLCRPPAALADCAVPSEPRLAVEIVTGTPGQDYSLSIAQLSKLPSESRRAGMERFKYTLGLTDASFHSAAQMDMLTTPDGSDRFCTFITAATVTLEWKTLVHIASELKPGSCVYNVVTRHEQRHVGLDRSLMLVARAALTAAITRATRDPVSGTSVDQGRRELEARIKAAIEHSMSVFGDERTRRQLSLDTPEEYQKVPNTCGRGAVAQLLHE